MLILDAKPVSVYDEKAVSSEKALPMLGNKRS